MATPYYIPKPTSRCRRQTPMFCRRPATTASSPAATRSIAGRCRRPSRRPEGGENAFGVDFPVDVLGPWVAPNQHNIVLHNGEPHHVVIIPDKDAEFVNTDGDSSLRGGCIAQKCYNPQTPTRDRLKTPLMRIYGMLHAGDLGFRARYRRREWQNTSSRPKHGSNAYGVKTFSYQYIENTYAISKYALRYINTANFTFHDTPSDVTSTPGFRDAGFDNFGPATRTG